MLCVIVWSWEWGFGVWMFAERLVRSLACAWPRRKRRRRGCPAANPSSLCATHTRVAEASLRPPAPHPRVFSERLRVFACRRAPSRAECSRCPRIVFMHVNASLEPFTRIHRPVAVLSAPRAFFNSAAQWAARAPVPHVARRAESAHHGDARAEHAAGRAVRPVRGQT